MTRKDYEKYFEFLRHISLTQEMTTHEFIEYLQQLEKWLACGLKFDPSDFEDKMTLNQWLEEVRYYP